MTHTALWVLALIQIAAPGVGRAQETQNRTASASDTLAGRVVRQIKEKATTTSQTTADWTSWLTKRRQFTYQGVPYGFTGLPVVYFNTASEWNRGVRMKLTDYSRKPFGYKVTLNWVQSTGNKSNFFTGLRVPSIAGTKWGTLLQFDITRGFRPYLGLGNSKKIDRRLTDPASPLFKDEEYFLYRLHKSRLFFSLLRQVQGPVVASVGFGIRWAEISQPGAASLLFDEMAYGLPGGTTGLVSLVLRWDTRDDETIPQHGTLHEWSYELAHGSPVDKDLFNAIAFHRYTMTDLRYLALSERANLASRMVFEVLEGKPPVDVYGDIGGIRRRVSGLGGGETLRGFSAYRFVDKVRYFSNTELRYRILSQRLFMQYLEWHGVAFMDLGRVWPSPSALTPRGMHLTGGGGVRLYWNMDFVARLEMAVSAEQTFVGVQLGNVF